MPFQQRGNSIAPFPVRLHVRLPNATLASLACQTQTQGGIQSDLLLPVGSSRLESVDVGRGCVDGLSVGDSDCAKKQSIDQQPASLNLHLVLLLLDSLP